MHQPEDMLELEFKPCTVFKLYRYVELLNQEFNACMSTMTAWLQVMMIVCLAGCNFVMIRSYVGIAPLIGLVAISVAMVFIVILVFPLGGAVNSNSRKCLISWKGVISCRELRGCRPLRIRIGSMLYFQPFTVLKTIRLIIFWTARAMLIFN